MGKQKGLNLNDTIHYNKWDKYVVAYAENADAVGLRDVFKTEVVYFVHMMATDVQTTADRANYDLSGITAAKDLAKKDASEALGAVTSNAVPFAISKRLTTLKAQMKNSSVAKLLKEKDENFVSKCNNINTLLTDAIADYPTAVDFYTAEQLSDAMLKVADFDGKLGKWAVKVADVNNAKIEFEFDLMPKMADSLVYQEALLPGAITTNFPTFAKLFLSLKKLVRVGVRGQVILPTMEDSETAALFILNGKMETLDYVPRQKWQMTNSMGLFKLMKMTVGVWKIKFSAPGYDDQIIEATVNAKEITKIDVKLVKTVVAEVVVV